MLNTTPKKIKDINLLVYSELTRIEKIVDSRLITDTGSTDIGAPPVSTLNRILWTQNWDALYASLNTYININRTVAYQKLMMTIANHSLHKLDAAIAEPVKMKNLLDFGGLGTTLPASTDLNLLYTDLTTFKAAVDGAWATEQTKIETFSSTVTTILVYKGIAELMKNPTVVDVSKSQGYIDGFKNLNHSLPM